MFPGDILLDIENMTFDRSSCGFDIFLKTIVNNIWKSIVIVVKIQNVVLSNP
ncbi:MAG: hypothetical protein Q4A23_02575 [bacterium]|nr:hypothetical protein [bacterium]